jgi:predicted SAM-dependent methyltransferase
MSKLHIGSGKINMEGYINIDIEPSSNPDICGNILGMEFSDVDAIYSCHCMEHLSYPEDAVKLLSLCYSWLRDGCALRLAVPDLELAAKAYCNRGDLRFLYAKDFKAYYYKDTAAERLNFFVKSWGHKICYDFELLSLLLRDAGFRHIERKRPNESAIEGFSHDRFISESLYIEAIK